MTNAKRKADPTDLAIIEMEQQIAVLKGARSKFIAQEIKIPEYSHTCEEAIMQLRESLQVFHRSYIPFTLPKSLTLPLKPPSWLDPSESLRDDYQKISKESEIEQSNLVCSYRRPGMNQTAITRALKLLSKEQVRNFIKYRWKQITALANDFVDSLKTTLPPLPKPSQTLTSKLHEFIVDQEIEIPTSRLDLPIYILQLFDEGSPIEGGLAKKTIQDEIVGLSAGISALTPSILPEYITDLVMPTVASLHFDNLLMDMKVKSKTPCESLLSVISLFGDSISMEDFGSTGEVNGDLVRMLMETAMSQSVNEISNLLLKAATLALKESEGPLEAAKRLAVALVQAHDETIPAYVYLVCAWGSKESGSKSTITALFLQAFDDLVGLIPT